MNRKSKSREWFNKHRKDPYVQKAQQAGHRSRASFKLIEIQDKYQIIKQRNSVCDLGSAPGGWSELITKWVGPKGKAIACDLLEMETIADVDFIQGDFTEIETQALLLAANDDKPFDVIVSDMAPNTIGHQATDQLRSVGLIENVLWFAQAHLSIGGACIVKVFQGVGFDTLVKDFRQTFKKVIIVKPASSKRESKEVYLVAIALRESR